MKIVPIPDPFEGKRIKLDAFLTALNHLPAGKAIEIKESEVSASHLRNILWKRHSGKYRTHLKDGACFVWKR